MNSIVAALRPERMREARMGGPQLSVAFVLLPEFTLMALTGFVEALRLAADDGDRSRQLHCRWTVMAPDRRPIRSSAGIDVLPWETFQDPGGFDYVVVVGGLMKGHARAAPAIYDYLRAAAGRGTGLVGLCTGSFALAEAGLMDGHRCCVHWYHLQEFEERYPHVEAVADKLYVFDRQRITSSGGGGVVDLAIHLLQRHCGDVRALTSLKKMSFDQLREAQHPQPRFASCGSEQLAREAVADPLVERAVQLMEQRLGAPLSVAGIARRLGVGRRQLERQFAAALGASPAGYGRRLRLEHGRWLLGHTRRSVTEIALECGFADASHFTRCFRGAFAQSPRDFRRTGTGHSLGDGRATISPTGPGDPP